ncbi:IclR family transcriptional regulator domain-containing protein [Streptomyces akebiae]|uniref:Helix-turn-helix domain-containing protein n=1 Tax=Streptomyces akebiae TaxID=2865673 RepID=A0ABX8XK41_9ACTN|nr:IclR family transcriptional regulator C-terminal domain-containing protein [Streptomyces akebiae]QYX76211.1 helix-turn-helix domain-containing protein [Streptomyces akebiae]
MADRARFGAAREPHFVRSFERGLAVIRAFDAEHPALTLSEVARTCELTRAAARRFLLTLVDLGYVHTDGRLFRLTPRVLELGYAYLSSFTLPDLAEPHLERLAAQVGESSSLCVLDGDDIVYVARVSASRIMTATITVGTRFPAHVTSVGRVILAHLPDEEIDARLARADLVPLTRRTLTSADQLRAELRRVRRQGYALVDQELEEGLRSVAVPVRDRDAEVVAAVNIPVHAGRTSVEAVRRDLLPHLLATVARIEADLCVTGTAAGRARAATGAAPAGRPGSAATGRAPAVTPGSATRR